MENGFVKGRIKVGITFYGVSEEAAANAKVAMKAGLYIVDIDESCDIANTELAVDDVITSVNGVNVTSLSELKELLDALSPGDEVSAHVYRPALTGEGKEFDISFRLMEDDGGLKETEVGKNA